MSVLNEIFSKFPRGTKQRSNYLKNWCITPLHVAAKNGHLAAYKLIMETVTDKNPLLNPRSDMYGLEKMQQPKELHCIQNFYGCTPLHLAAIYGHISICKMIMANLVEKNPTNSSRYTPLHGAAAGGHLQIFKFIIKSKNPKDINGYSPFDIAAAYGHFSICCAILKYSQIVEDLSRFVQQSIASKQTLHFPTPFHLAAANGHTRIYQLMINKIGKGGNSLINSRPQIPLHLAAQYGHLNVCKLILENNESKEMKLLYSTDGLDRSPLELAKRNNHSDIENYFLETHAKWNIFGFEYEQVSLLLNK